MYAIWEITSKKIYQMSYTLYYPEKRGERFSIMLTHDENTRIFKEKLASVIGENPMKIPIFIRDFEEKFKKVADKSGLRCNEFKIYHHIGEHELKIFLGEN